jgi:hypothetical protein
VIKTLALDLGTNTGYAYNSDTTFYSGTWVHGTDKEIRAWGKNRMRRRSDPRISRFYAKLIELKHTIPFDQVIFEDVEFNTYTYQCQLWSSYRAAIWLAFPGEIIECVPVSTLKLFATGYGGADKSAMRRALDAKHPGHRAGADDNEVDAIWLWQWAKTNLSRIKR